MSLFKKDEPKEGKWDKLIDEQYDKMPTYQDDKDYNKGLELLVKMKENQEAESKVVPVTTQEKIQDGIQIGSLIISALGIGAGLFLGIGSYRSDENGELPHSKTWNIGQKLMDKATNHKK